jgi:hypothetical protein
LEGSLGGKFVRDLLLAVAFQLLVILRDGLVVGRDGRHGALQSCSAALCLLRGGSILRRSMQGSGPYLDTSRLEVAHHLVALFTAHAVLRARAA